jgi:glycerophosphoryl diester phosphodiesterase
MTETRSPGQPAQKPLALAGRSLADALRGLRANLPALATTYVLYQAIAFAVLTPLLVLLARLLINESGSGALTDADIAVFLLASPFGIAALVLVAAIAIGITALQVACLLTIGLAGARGTRLRVCDAFAHGISRAFRIVRVTAILVVRLILLALPFVAALGATYWLLLRAHDINYYLSAHPPEFWVAVAIGGVIAVALLIVLARRATSWLLVLPIVVFEPPPPHRAFGESARRMQGRRAAAAFVLLAWAIGWALISSLVSGGLRALGRATAPLLGGSLPSLLFFIGLYLVVAVLVALVVGMLAAAVFALIVAFFYREAGLPADVALPHPFDNKLELAGRRLHVSWAAIVGSLAAAVVVMVIVANVFMKSSWTEHPVRIFAHRGASKEAPENTLAAFRKAGTEHTDFVELDVQESSDGVVLVNHDEDLMKLARSPLKIWQTPAAQIQAVDIGSSTSPAFSDQRVPTLAAVLEACKGVSEVDIELKDYGHDQQLEERVVALVEAAGMQDHIVTMSLNPKMVARMKELRPHWTSGVLITKSIGNPRALPGDFLAVQKALATRRFIREVHSMGRPVFVWTVDDPQTMLRFVGLGIDGLITDEPAVAREALANYHAMTQAQRLLLYMMTYLGSKEEVLPPEHELRP